MSCCSLEQKTNNGIMKKLILLSIILLLTFYFSPFNIKAQTTEPILRLNSQMHTVVISRISTDASGKYILTASLDKTAKLWDAVTGDLLKTFRPPIDDGKEGMLYAGALSPNGKIAVVAGRTGYEWDKTFSIYLFNTNTGELIQRLTGLGNVIIDLEFSPDGTYLGVALGGTMGVVIYKTNLPNLNDMANLNVSKHKTLTGYGDNSSNIAFDNTGRLATVCDDGKIRFYDNQFKLIKERTGTGNKPSSIAFSPYGNKIAVGYRDALDIEVFSGKNLKLLYKPELGGMNEKGGLSGGLSFSQDGEYLYGSGRYSQIINDRQRMIIRRWNNAGQGNYTDIPIANNLISDIKSFPNGDVVFGSLFPELCRIEKYDSILYHLKGEINDFDEENRFRVTGEYIGINISFDGTQLEFKPLYKSPVSFDLTARQLERINGINRTNKTNTNDIFISDWQTTKDPKVNGKSIFEKTIKRYNTVDISDDENRIVFGTDYTIICINKQNEILWEPVTDGNVWAVNISGNGKFVVATLSNGVINWYRMNDGELLLTLYAHPDNKQWILFSPKGCFDCSPGAEELAGWHVNQGPDKGAKFYPLSQFYEQYYTPNLGARVLAGEEISSGVDIKKDFKLPPLVEITTPKNNSKLNNKELTVNVKVTDQGGGIDEIRLYLNGKLVVTTQQGIGILKQTNAANSKTFTITLANGENLVRVTAFNNQRTESIPDEISIFLEGTQKKSNLHMLVIGIDKYKNQKYNINYAVSDATSFKEEIEKGCKDIFNSVNVTILKDAEATRLRMLVEFDRLKTNAIQEDVFILYYAGHGVMSIEDKSQFYIVLYDVTSLYGNNEMLRTKAISANELQTFSTELKAQKQMFVFDACQSGGMTKMLAQRGAAEEKALAQLARSTGTYWLVASGTEQIATEFGILGHGLFTHCVLLGLQGEADGGNNDNKITVKELSSFLDDKVPELSEKLKGTSQYPNIYGYGMDFPIVTIKYGGSIISQWEEIRWIGTSIFILAGIFGFWLLFKLLRRGKD